MSVGYDLEGIQGEKIDEYLNGMMDASGTPSGHDVLGQLGVGSGGGAEGGLDPLIPEDGQTLLPGAVGPVNAKDGPLPAALRHDPGHQLLEGDGNHLFRHGFPLLFVMIR